MWCIFSKWIFFCTKLFCDAKLIWRETLENVIGLNWFNIQWSSGKLFFFSSKKSSNFVLKSHNLPWAIITKFKINEGIATGNNSHNTAKWSYLDHPVRTKPLNDTFPELSVSRLITSSQARKEFWMKFDRLDTFLFGVSSNLSQQKSSTAEFLGIFSRNDCSEKIYA